MAAEVRWASSGAMALTGDADGPPLAPPTDAAERVDRQLAPVGLDARVLGERAAMVGLVRRGGTSCGGATRLLATADGWISLALARPDDVAMVPALLGRQVTGDPWVAVSTAVATWPAAEVVERAALIGMAVGAVGEARGAGLTVTGARRPHGGAPARRPLVVDLSALWAGPLCADLLRRDGARVVKVESVGRPDGARSGHPAFFALLNGGKESVAVDLARDRGRAALASLVDAADIVVTSARARAIAGLGLDVDAWLGAGTDRIWVAVTGHGWASNRVGFGDDAAAAAGLVAWGDDGRPRFAGDALADPLTGSAAFDAARQAWARGGRWFVDAPLVGAAAGALFDRGPARSADGSAEVGWSLDGHPVASPEPRQPERPAPALGADTDRILAELTP